MSETPETPKEPTEPIERYTSYHTGGPFSILDRVRGLVYRATKTEEDWGFLFEYNGISYSVRKGELLTTGLIRKYNTPSCDGEGFGEGCGYKVITEFDGDKFDEFIQTFKIEGKTVEWILDHQREWKYKMSAEHFEKIVRGFSFWFLYRNIPGGLVFYQTTDKQHNSLNYPLGVYLYLYPPVSFDVTKYAPATPGATPWWEIFNFSAGENIVTMIGPFETVGKLLDSVRLGNKKLEKKTLREIFDTEYDDGDGVFCGTFDG